MIKRTILILEDDMLQRESLCRWMNEYAGRRSISLQILTAASIAEARAALVGHPPVFAFFLDISLKEDDKDHGGLEFSRFLQETSAYRHTPLIYVTSYGDYLKQALNTFHCFAFLLKPYTKEELFTQLDDLFDSHIEQLYVRDPEGIYHALSLDSLLYVHSEGRYLHYFTGEYEVRSRQFSMTELLGKLPSHFVRCHKSYIMNTEITYIPHFVKNFLIVFLILISGLVFTQQILINRRSTMELHYYEQYLPVLDNLIQKVRETQHGHNNTIQAILHLIVVDNPGETVNDAFREQILKRGYTTKTVEAEKHGLGLSILQNIVKKHNGALMISNALHDELQYISFTLLL